MRRVGCVGAQSLPPVSVEGRWGARVLVLRRDCSGRLGRTSRRPWNRWMTTPPPRLMRVIEAKSRRSNRMRCVDGSWIATSGICGDGIPSHDFWTSGGDGFGVFVSRRLSTHPASLTMFGVLHSMSTPLPIGAGVSAFGRSQRHLLSQGSRICMDHSWCGAWKRFPLPQGRRRILLESDSLQVLSWDCQSRRSWQEDIPSHFAPVTEPLVGQSEWTRFWLLGLEVRRNSRRQSRSWHSSLFVSER